MSDYVKIKRKGIYGYSFDKERRKYVGRKVKRDNIISVLRSPCTIDDGVILLDIIKHVEHYKALKLFLKQYSWCNSIDELNLDAYTPVTDESVTQKLVALDIVKYGLIIEVKDESRYSVNCDFYGVDNKGTEYSVSYCPMNEIAYLPVRLKTVYDINNGFSGDKLLTSTIDFSLLEVLDAIYWDISFVGGPEEKSDFIGSMQEKLEDYETHSSLIRDFSFEDGHFIITNKAGSTIKVPLASLPYLAKHALEDVLNYELDIDGSFVCWPSLDIHCGWSGFLRHSV